MMMALVLRNAGVSILLYLYHVFTVMQFAGIVLFGVAFPLAPFLALVNNVIEIRLDAMSYVKHTCRMVASLAQDIGEYLKLSYPFSACTHIMTNVSVDLGIKAVGYFR